MTGINHPPPQFSVADAKRVLLDHYDLGAADTLALSPLPSERDQNFRVDTPAGRRFIFKIVNEAEPPASVAFQGALLDHLRATDPGLPVPRLVPTRSGDTTCSLAGTAGPGHLARLVTWLDGTPLAEAGPNSANLRSLGSVLGRLDRALGSLGHAGAHRDFEWDLRATPQVRGRLHTIQDPERRALVEAIVGRYEGRVAPVLGGLRHGVIHNDANDWNILVTGDAVTGLIDFGDALHAPLIADLAVACAYAMLNQPSPVEAAAAVVAGYDEVMPLEDIEFEVLLDLAQARLALSVSISAERQHRGGDNPYHLVSERAAWELVAKLSRIDRQVATAILRSACGREAAPGARRLVSWLANNRRAFVPVMHPAPARSEKVVLDLADATQPLVAAIAAQDHAAAAHALEQVVSAAGATLGIGAWNERRAIYTAPAFASTLSDGAWRDVHFGVDLFAPPATPVYLPLAGTVVTAVINAGAQDYGGLLVLAHEPEPGLVFHTLWGHLSHASVRARRVGERLPAGDELARLGAEAENGGWPPHLHLQILANGREDFSATPGVGEARFRAAFAELFPSPHELAGLPPETFTRTGRDRDTALAERRRRLGPNLSLSYRSPLKIVRGEDVWLVDDRGRAYLDCYNNVAHVGHCHPRLAGAIARQAAILNTNTRYLHDLILDYTARLERALPRGLDTFYLTCSGSEANELAVRMARSWSGRRDMLVVDWAYHGTTQALIELSPYKYKRKGGRGRPDATHEVPLPESYRAPADWPAEEIGRRHAAIATALIRDGAVARPPAAFIAETIPSVAGQVFLPAGWLAEVYAAVRAAGGLCIADEVQVGFGRVGDAMWAFEEHGVVPDIVTLGKPIGNGHPMGVVAVRRDVAEAFANGMEYFNTFGGNPVSCAAGLAVLDVLEEEGLLANAAREGAFLLQGFRQLQERHSCIGDVRGRGLFLGIEIVKDRATKEHDGPTATAVVNRARELGVLAGTDGPHDNVIKLRPPMTFRREHGEILLDTFDRAFGEVKR